MLDKQDEVVFTLDDIQHSCPNALRHAMYWICRAKLAENVGDHERVVCMFEQAIVFSAQPEEEIKNALSDYKNRKQYREEKKPKALSRMDREMFNSSVVKFSLLDSTPFRTRRKLASGKRVLRVLLNTARSAREPLRAPRNMQDRINLCMILSGVF